MSQELKVTSNESIEESLNWRYAVKRYDPDRRISAADWRTLTASLVLAPSSYGLQPWRFVAVQDPALREQLKAASWNQTQVKDASHFVVFTSLEQVTVEDVDHYMDRISEVRGAPRESLKGFHEMLTKNLVEGMTPERALHWTQRQAYIAMGFLLETASLLHVDATPMEGLDAAAYDKVLGLEGTGYRTVAAVALGYRHPEDGMQNSKKVRFDESEVIQYK